MSSQEGQCPIEGECAFAGICQGGDTSLVLNAIQTSPEVQILGSELSEDELQGLARPIVQAWDAAPCLREKVRALKAIQFERDISHVSMTMGVSVLERIEEVLGVS